MYGSDTQRTFQITDILAKNCVIINKTYKDRLDLLTETLEQIGGKLQNLNAFVSFKIHDKIFEYNTENSIFIGITDEYVEIIDGYKKHTENPFIKEYKGKVINKTITSVFLPDVYNVFNVDTNEKEGILYVKTIKESKKLALLFKTESRLVLPCEFNEKFKRWQVYNP
jgi:hypothetical protein